MYSIAQALLILDANVLNEDDYWSMKARKFLNLTTSELRSLKEYSHCETIRQFVDFNDKVQQSLGQMQVYTDMDLSSLTRLYSITY